MEKMARSSEVKEYIAYWFQVGKKIKISNLNEAITPKTIFYGDGYSDEFERLWKLISSQLYAPYTYLEGTNQSLQELLSSKWDIISCSRCTMPVPILHSGLAKNSNCVCSDLDSWPNTKLPFPRSPIDAQQNLSRIKVSLERKSGENPTMIN